MSTLSFRARLAGMSKWRLFALFVLATSAAAGVLSLIAYITVLDRSASTPVRVALIAPMTGPDREIGRSMRAGVDQYLAEIAKRGGPAGHPVELLVIDEATATHPAEAVLADPAVIGVIGPFGSAAAAASRVAFEAAGMPVLTMATENVPEGAPPGATRALFEMAPRPDQEMRFLANYVRNVLGEPLVSVILADDPAQAALADTFDAVLQRFGTRVVYRWTVPAGAAGPGAIKSIAAEIADRKVAGTLLVLGSQTMSAKVVAALRAADVPNRIVGPRALATAAFTQSLTQALAEVGGVALAATPGTALNGTVVTSPMLFDTAGIAAQDFRDHVGSALREPPDWLSVLAYDAARSVGTAVQGLPNAAADSPAALRSRVRAALDQRATPEKALKGLGGPIYFDRVAGGSLAELVGVYDGTDLISAPIQLSPIREQGVPDYLEELTSGRALYVNDRFMYKTNVVYTGMRLEKVLELNTDTNIADVEFVMWFRWRGNFDPQTISFPNAVSPVSLASPERESKSEDANYRSYRVRGKFFMNYSDEPHRFGTQVIEVKFRHRNLSRNNLLYVSDMLGMGLENQAGVSRKGNWLQELFGIETQENRLTRAMSESRVLAGVSGWLTDRAWLSQQVEPAGSDGNPVFVGFGKPQAEFSTMGFGLVVQPDAFDIAASVPKNLLVYLAIFAACLTVLAHLLDRRERGYFWRIQTLLLRLIAWPTLLASVASLALDYMADRTTPSGLQAIASLASMLWWIVPARLLVITIERFLWVPLEISTGRRIPTVFRMIVATLIYVLAAFGLIAFVLGKSVTSLLATSGVLTLILGLALQSNLRDIVSGIMLNLERPFAINDMLDLGRQGIATVIDISWRTVRMRTNSGAIIALPNGRMSDAEIINVSQQAEWDIVIPVMVDPSVSPDLVLAALREGGEAVPLPLKVKFAALNAVEKHGDSFVATYALGLTMPDRKTSQKARGMAGAYVIKALQAAGVTWSRVTPSGEHAADLARV